MNKFKLLLLTGAFALAPVLPTFAAGMWTNGSPQVPITGTASQPGNYPQLTGQELLPFDTGLPAGAYPQSAAVNVGQLVMLGAVMASSSTSATGTGATGTATLSTDMGVITSGAITTAAGGTYTITVTNTKIATTSNIQGAVYNMGATTGLMQVTSITPASGSFVVVLTNISSVAINGTVTFAFWVKN